MDALHTDVLNCIVTMCSVSSLLALSMVNRRINAICTNSWGQRYIDRYGTRAVCNARDVYRARVFSSGRVLRYHPDEGVATISSRDSMKYISDDFYINVDGQCIYRGSILEMATIDIGYKHDELSVLTRTHYAVYDVATMGRTCYIDVYNGKRLVYMGISWHPELSDGRVLGRIGCAVDISQMHTVGTLDLIVPTYNVLTNKSFVALFTDTTMYVYDTRYYGSLRITRSVPLIVTQGIACRGGLLLLTNDGKLIRYSLPSGEMKIEATHIVANSLVKVGRSAYCVQWYL
jgi:hypothetical protein